tara:strand:+ start:129 stop:494 length:366 start_codon:yes stop_codon:yes gene_type:complete
MARPTVMTKDVLSKLQHAFTMGCTDIEACMYAGCSESALYRYEEKHEEYRKQKAVWKSNPFMLARMVLVDALVAKDVNTAHKMIDRKEGGKLSLDHTSSDGSMKPTMIQLMPVTPDDNSDS